MDAAIVANPHKEPEAAKDFIEMLVSRRRFMRGEDEAPPELDVEGFLAFKKEFGQTSKMLKIK